KAEDGIRDDLVTGVQTCALPISRRSRDLVAAVKRSAQREPQRDAPLARKTRVGMSQRDDIVWHLTYKDASRGGFQHRLAMRARGEDWRAAPAAKPVHVQLRVLACRRRLRLPPAASLPDQQ